MTNCYSVALMLRFIYFFVLISALSFITGCAAIWGWVADNADKKSVVIGEIDLGVPQILNKSLMLPKGDAYVGVVVPGWLCMDIPKSKIKINISDRNGAGIFEMNEYVDNLTWSHSREECADGFGYIEHYKKNSSMIEIKRKEWVSVSVEIYPDAVSTSVSGDVVIKYIWWR